MKCNDSRVKRPAVKCQENEKTMTQIYLTFPVTLQKTAILVSKTVFLST